MRLLIGLLFVTVVPTIGVADTIWVPDDHATIQAAIVAAQDGDEVIVKPGTYVENIDFLGKAITVRSERGPGITTIDGNYLGSVVMFASGEGAASVLSGFTITHGTSWGGGGIRCTSSSPTIVGNTITENYAFATRFGQGGGIYCYSNSFPIIAGNTIIDNEASGGLGGIGSAVYLSSNSSATITGNTIAGNLLGGAAIVVSNSSATIANTILWNDDGYEVALSFSSTLSISYSDVEGGQSSVYVGANSNLNWESGMIDADPLFVSLPPHGDFFLSQIAAGQGADSPCLDAGDPGSSMVAGTTRTDWVQDAGVVDMGYHYSLPMASATYRNAGSNPASYDAVTMPILGTTYTASIDVGGTTGHSLAWLVGYTTPLALTLGGGQTILVNVADPNGELLMQPMLPGPIATYLLPVASDIAFVGFELSTQALHIGGVQPFALSNAQDLILGF